MPTSPSLPPDSSSSSSSPSLPFRPFSLLPTELVQHIVESTVPLSFHLKTYHQRQITLRSVALVSRLFHQIAQPLLLAVVKVDSKRTLLFRMELSRTDSAYLRDLVWNVQMENQLLSLLPSLANLRVLVLNFFCLDIAVLENLAHLTTLRLTNVSIWSARSFTLAQVREVQLLDVKSRHADQSLGDIFDTSTVPALRALVYWRTGGEVLDANELLRNLDCQVEALSMDRHIVKRLGADVFAAVNDKTLFDVPLFDERLPSGPPVKHLRVHFDPLGLTPIELSAALKSVQALVNPERTSSLPIHLYLPPLPLYTSTSAHSTGRALDELVQACDAQKVTVVYEEQPIAWAFDSGISMDFWRRMKELKAKGGKE
ncbi:hypothetical protein JCM5353_007165 [Sporobolomyces roseus]